MKVYETGRLSLPVLEQNFMTRCIDNDKWKQLKEEFLVETDNEGDRVHKADLARLYNIVYSPSIQLGDDTAMAEGQRIGLRYDRGLRENGRTGRGDGGGPTRRGVFVGVRIRWEEIYARQAHL